MRRTLLAMLSSLVVSTAGAQTPAPGAAQFNASAAPVTIRLWEGAAPGAMGTADADIPMLEIFRATRGAGPAAIVAPSGAYGALSMNSEGRWVATWLNSLGINAFVLKYRIAPYRHPVPGR